MTVMEKKRKMTKKEPEAFLSGMVETYVAEK